MGEENLKVLACAQVFVEKNRIIFILIDPQIAKYAAINFNDCRVFC